ncbi:mandelate racemase/muconate lactonizing enzyme family protein [Humitalea sp. 24SJ18S-53]|uniref:mandelate racemase/muconate lactonizing enzyme family protein n=1 Tax=Humitalea sp. 24SJ18S-53 TaxID=3422307 RepID=UPI003D66AF6E
MRITAVRAWLLDIPLATPFVISRGAVHSFRNLVVEIETDDGILGYGEAVPVSLRGDPMRYLRAVEQDFAPRLLGRDPGDIEAIMDRLLQMEGEGITAAAAGVDLALWDILGKRLDVPAYALLGGLCQDGALVDYTISVAHPAVMADAARDASMAGFTGVVVKVACRDIATDVACTRAVRAVLPDSATLRVDCNGGHDRDGALAFIRALDGIDVEFVEQPVAAADIEGLALCRGHGMRIAADESLNTPADALRLVAAGACDVLNVKVPKAGGLLQSKRVAAIAAAAGLPLVVGGGLSYGISRFASQHLAVSSTAACGVCHEGPGPASQSLTDDITLPVVTRAPLLAHGGRMPVPAAPGLGFAVDRAKLSHYAKRSGA